MKMFPLLVDLSNPFLPFREVPWEFVEKYRKKIENDHSQTLEILAERGGLSPQELICHFMGVGLWNKEIHNLQARYTFTEIVFRMYQDEILVYKEE